MNLDINSFINNIDKETAQKINNLANTAEGQLLIKKLKRLDKNEILQHLSGLNEGNLSKEALIKQYINDPNIISKLNSILNGGKGNVR